MAAITAARLALARNFLDQWAKLERKNTDEVGWLMLKFSCSTAAAERLIIAVRQNTTTKNIGKTPTQRQKQDTTEQLIRIINRLCHHVEELGCTCATNEQRNERHVDHRRADSECTGVGLCVEAANDVGRVIGKW